MKENYFSFWCKPDFEVQKKEGAGGTLYILIENKVTQKMSDIYIAPPPFDQSSKIKVIPCTSNKICCESMLQCFRLCAPSAIQHSFDLYSLKWRNPLWLSSNSHFFFSYSESCLPEQECVFIGEWKLLKRHREVSARPKMHIFSIQVLWNTTKVTVKEIHFSIHTTRSMSVFFSLLKSKVHWVLATLNLTYAVCSKQKKVGNDFSQ